MAAFEYSAFTIDLVCGSREDLIVGLDAEAYKCLKKGLLSFEAIKDLPPTSSDESECDNQSTLCMLMYNNHDMIKKQVKRNKMYYVPIDKDTLEMCNYVVKHKKSWFKKNKIYQID